MKKLLQEYEDIALSNVDILKLLDGKANIVLYPQLHHFKNIDQLLEPFGACLLLFEAKPKYGHWTCIFKLDDNSIEFFNPYGGYPDDALKYIPFQFRQVTNQNHTYLSYLLYKSHYDLNYNEYKFQKVSKNIRTCGRHCVVRLLFRWMTLEQYHEFLHDLSIIMNMNYDEIVTYLTE